MNTFLNPVKNVAEKIFGKGPVVDEKTRTARLSKCLTCNQLIRSTMNCKKCICFVEKKIKYQLQKCPIGKW